MHTLQVLRPLKAIVSVPYATPAGAVVTRPGYDSGSGIYLHTPLTWAPNVPTSPSVAVLRRALVGLMAPWRGYSPVTPNDAGALVSAVLTALSVAVCESVPGVLWDAPTKGSGKTKGARSLGALIEGRAPPIIPYVARNMEEELNKQLVAGLLAGTRFYCIDNVTGLFRSTVLASVLTSGRFNGRILGQSKAVAAAPRALFTLTANNASMDDDMTRRMLQVRVDGGDRPTHRRFDFDPVAETLRLRRSIAEAACTIWAGYFAAGAPAIAKDDAGGLSDWNRLCRQPVLWLAREGLADGLEWQLGDPAASMLDTEGGTDPELEAVGDLLRELRALSGGQPFTARQVQEWVAGAAVGGFGTACRNPELRSAARELLGARWVDSPSSRSLGPMLMNRRDRPVRGLRLTVSDARGHGAALFRVTVQGG